MEVDTKHGILKDTIVSLYTMGATYVKCDGMDIFFTINKDSELKQESDKLRGVRDFMMKQFGYKLMVKFEK